MGSSRVTTVVSCMTELRELLHESAIMLHGFEHDVREDEAVEPVVRRKILERAKEISTQFAALDESIELTGAFPVGKGQAAATVKFGPSRRDRRMGG